MATRVIEVVDVGVARRRVFSDDDKARIVSEAMVPGAVATEVARRNGVCSSLLYRWRRKLVAERLAPGMVVDPSMRAARPGGASFVPVAALAGPGADGPPTAASIPAGAVEVITAAGARVRLVPPIDPRVLRAVLATLV